MASLKDIKRNIVAVKQTQKLTRAMNMVAAAKLRTTQSRTEKFRYYADEYSRLLGEISQRASRDAHPLLTPNPAAPNKVALVAMSSDRGLCGSFNTSIFQKMDAQLEKFKENGQDVELFLLGRKLKDYYARKPVKIVDALVGIMSDFTYLVAKNISDRLIHRYLNGEYSHIYLLYTSFESLAKHDPVVIPFLPLGSIEETAQAHKSQSPDKTGAEGGAFDYLVEPDPETLLNILIPKSLAILTYRAMLESATSEHAARMQAMDNANKNCKEMIESLTLLYNKARQAAVTTELLDIVGGAEALKG